MLKLVSETAETLYYRPVACDIADSDSRLEAFSDPGLKHEVLSQLERLHSLCPVRHLTLDVFDTVVLRNSKAESRRFWEIAGRVAECLRRHGIEGSNREGAPSLEQADVFVSRLMATRASYRTRRPVSHCREGSLTAIYVGMCGSLGLDPDLANELIDIELGYEMENTVRNPLIGDVIRFAAEAGSSISMISDMYMHAPQISRIVRHHFRDEADALGELVSSADESISKRSGHLFDFVAKREGLEPKDFLHIGDSVVGDFRSPILRGWRALLIPHAKAEQVAIEEDHVRFVGELASMGLQLDSWIKSGV